MKFICTGFVGSGARGAGLELDSGGKFTVTSNTLTIRSTIWSDSGLYSCKANNRFGEADAAATLTVYSKYLARTPWIELWQNRHM